MFVGGRQIGKYPEPPIYDGLNHHLYQYLDGLESRYIYICIHTYIYIYMICIYIYISKIYMIHTHIYISYIYVYVSYVYIYIKYIYIHVCHTFLSETIYLWGYHHQPSPASSFAGSDSLLSLRTQKSCGHGDGFLLIYITCMIYSDSIYYVYIYICIYR